MKINVKLADLNKDQILYEGAASLEFTKQQGRIITMESPDYKGLWKVLEYGCILEHQSENLVRVFLSEKGNSKAVIDTEFGRLELKADLLVYTQSDTQVMVEYTLDGVEEPFRFELIILNEGERAYGSN